jgi:hypothetical protein
MEHLLGLSAALRNTSLQFADCQTSGGTFCATSGRKFVVFDEESKGQGSILQKFHFGRKIFG